MAGHGSPPGVRQGGRRKGTPNKRTVERQTEMAELLAAGVTPLEFMLGIMRDERTDPSVRIEAARSAAPYCHPRLSAVDLATREGPLIVEISRFGGDDDKPGEAD